MIFDELVEAMEPAIWLRSSDRRLLSVQYGGQPHFPESLKWPRQLLSNTPLHFLATVDLSKLPTTPLEEGLALPELPKTGYFHFFADIDEEMSWDKHSSRAATRVIFTKIRGNQRLPPADTPEIGHYLSQTRSNNSEKKYFLPEMSLEPYVINTFGGIVPFPMPDDVYAAAAEAQMIVSMEDAIGSQFPLYEDPHSWKAIEAENPQEYIQIRHFRDLKNPNKKIITPRLHCPRHQILGVGKNIQGTAEDMYQEGTVLLLQIDSSDAKAGLRCWGALQFWIKPADLTARRFDKAWASLEVD